MILPRFRPPTVPAQPSNQLIRLIEEFAETQTLDAARQARPTAVPGVAVTAYTAVLVHPAIAVEERTFTSEMLGEAADALLERYRVREDDAAVSDLEAAVSLWREALDQPQPIESSLWGSIT